MMSQVKMIVAGAMLAAVLAAGTMTEARGTARRAQLDPMGRVAEVVVRADIPRFVTDTVYVRAVRDLAAVSAPPVIN